MKNFIKTFGLGSLVGVVAIALLMSFSGPVRDTFGALEFNRIESGVTNTRINVASGSSTTVLSAKSGRVYALMVNDCDYDIYGSLGGTASKAFGFRLNANGGAYEITPDNLFVGSITAIASISNGTDYCKVTVLEK